MAISRHNSPENRDIFVVDGEPVSFYLWGTGRDEGPGWALSEGQRELLTQRIEYYGGRVCDSLRGVNTIIVQERGLVELRERYVFVRDCYVEPPSFVLACIRNRKYAHEAPGQHPRAMGGRTPGTYRVVFTESDDDHICKFLSTAIPYPEAGGRQGNKVWQLLTQNALYVPELKWAKRHTWQSWRERYKKHRERFDPIIDAMVKKHPPPPDGKGLFPYDRRVNGQHFDPFLLQREEEEEDDDQGEFQRTPDDEEEEEEEFDDHPDDVHFEQDVSRGHARRQTDPGPRRATSSAEPRGRPRTRADPRQLERTTPDEVEEYHDFDYQPGEDIAGPSGTQGNPLQSPIAPSPPQQPTRRTVAPRPVARPSGPAVMERRATQMPMSSQATLVGPVPTQLRGVSTSQKKQQQAQAGPGPSTLALRQTGVRAASRANAVSANDDEEDEDEEDEDEDEDQEFSEEEPQSHTHGQTNEEEQDVEDILDESYEQSAPDPEGEVEVEAGLEDEEVEVEVVYDLEDEEPEEDEDEIAPSMEVQLDSDDERTRRKLLDSRPRQAAQAGPSRTKSSRKRAAPQQDDDDDIEFAESLDIDNPAPRRSSVVPSASPVRRSLAATPHPASAGRRTRAETDPGYTSSESAVPLPNTKASAEKKRRRIEERYEPPAGTRAAEVSARRPAPKAPSPQVRQLRSRTVQRR